MRDPLLSCPGAAFLLPLLFTITPSGFRQLTADNGRWGTAAALTRQANVQNPSWSGRPRIQNFLDIDLFTFAVVIRPSAAAGCLRSSTKHSFDMDGPDQVKRRN